jgi:DNA processing protein
MFCAEASESARAIVAVALGCMEFLAPRRRVEALQETTLAELESMTGVEVAALRRSQRPRRSAMPPAIGSVWARKAEQILSSLTRDRLSCIFLWQNGYPSLLRELHDPPVVLFYRGRLPETGAQPVAVIGTRHPTGIGRACASELGHQLGAAGVPVVSGLARGIDVASRCVSGRAWRPVPDCRSVGLRYRSDLSAE